MIFPVKAVELLPRPEMLILTVILLFIATPAILKAHFITRLLLISALPRATFLKYVNVASILLVPKCPLPLVVAIVAGIPFSIPKRVLPVVRAQAAALSAPLPGEGMLSVIPRVIRRVFLLAPINLHSLETNLLLRGKEASVILLTLVTIARGQAGDVTVASVAEGRTAIAFALVIAIAAVANALALIVSAELVPSASAAIAGEAPVRLSAVPAVSAAAVERVLLPL